MALIKCGECGKEISSKAKSCPNCGCPINDDTNLPRKKVVIKKCFHLALRTSVFIDNQPVGEIGVGANKIIELELPIGTHYIGLNTGVAHGNVFAPMAMSNASDGKQFTISEDDEIIEIEILAKGSWSNSSGRCIVGNINKYNADEMVVKNDEIQRQATRENTKNNIIDKIINLSILVVIILLISYLLRMFSISHLKYEILMLVVIIIAILIFIRKKR